VHSDGIVIEVTKARRSGQAGQGEGMDIAAAGIGWPALGKHERRSVKGLAGIGWTSASARDAEDYDDARS